MGTCKKIAGMIGAYIYGDLTPDEMRYVRLHAEECRECSQEIEARIKAIALVPTDIPTLTDKERQRVAWTVKGAVRARQERRGFRLLRPTFAQGFALASLLVAAFAGGAILGYSKIPPKVIVKHVPAENQSPAEGKTERIVESPVPKQTPSPAKLPTNVTVAVQPFVRYPIQETYRGNIDRDSEKQEDAAMSILGDKPSETEPGDSAADSLGLSIIPAPDPLSSTIIEPDLLSPNSPAPVEPKDGKPGQGTTTDSKNQ